MRSDVGIAISPLRIERTLAAGCNAAGVPAADHLIGGLSYGVPPPEAAAGRMRLADVPALPLPGTSARSDLLLCGAVQAQGRCGQVQWCHDGQWLFGRIDLPETDGAGQGERLELLARQAYLDVFATLDQTGFAELQRLWNYVPRINEDGDGLERYRRFNSGRQRAFLEARRDAFDGAPAACALGTRSAALSVRFLAGRNRPLAIENPRQVSAYRYPSEFGPRSPTFSRAALADVGGGHLALLISGTASIVGHRSVHPGDVRAQTREALVNLRAVIAAARAHCDADLSLNALQAVIYLRAPADQAAVRAVFEAELGSDAPLLRDAVWLQADICRRELLVEIEGHAVAPGRLRSNPSDPSLKAAV